MSRRTINSARLTGKDNTAGRVAATVFRIARSLRHVGDIKISGPRCKHHGKSRVKIPEMWQKGVPAVIPITVYDTDAGQYLVSVETTRPGAESRLLRKRLLEEGLLQAA